MRGCVDLKRLKFGKETLEVRVPARQSSLVTLYTPPHVQWAPSTYSLHKGEVLPNNRLQMLFFSLHDALAYITGRNSKYIRGQNVNVAFLLE